MHMATEPDATTIQQRRKRLAEMRGEPLETVERAVYDHNGSYYVNVPLRASKLWDVDAATEMNVEIHDDRLVVRPQIDDGEGNQ